MQILTPDSPGLTLLRALNTEHAQELSYTEAPHFTHLVAQAFFARHIGTSAFIHRLR